MDVTARSKLPATATEKERGGEGMVRGRRGGERTLLTFKAR